MGKQKILDETAIVLEYASGSTYKKLGEKHKCSASVIGRIINQHNAANKHNSRLKLSNDVLHNMAVDYVGGMGCNQIAIKYNCNSVKIIKILKEYDDMLQVLSYYSNGLTLRQISQKFNCSAMKIYRILSKQGVVTRGHNCHRKSKYRALFL